MGDHMKLEDKLRQNLEVLQSLGHQNQETINRIVELITKDSNNFEDELNLECSFTSFLGLPHFSSRSTVSDEALSVEVSEVLSGKSFILL